MAYSDYGGFAWTVKNGIWERFADAEDGTLVGVKAPSDRPLETAFGLKFDVLINAYEKQGLDYAKDSAEQSANDWITKHPHHCVLGSMEGIGLCGHKGHTFVTLDGKRVKDFPVFPEWDSKSNSYVGGERDPYESGDEEVIDLGEWRYALKVGIKQSAYVMMALLLPDKTVQVGVSGYGIGDHWWKDDEGYEHVQPGDILSCMPKERVRNKPRKSKSKSNRKRSKLRSRIITKSLIGMTLEERKALEAKYDVCEINDSYVREEDMKKYGISDEYADMGRKPMEPWPSYEGWMNEVRGWADPILKKWRG